MKIYIASSWKNQHAVEMLTAALRQKGHTVLSFVENNYGENHSWIKPMPFDEWMKTEASERAFAYDTGGAMNSDLVIYIGPSGKDAAAEMGMAFAKNIPIMGLWAKGEDFGLMRKCINWYERYEDLLSAIPLAPEVAGNDELDVISAQYETIKQSLHLSHPEGYYAHEALKGLRDYAATRAAERAVSE